MCIRDRGYPSTNFFENANVGFTGLTIAVTESRADGGTLNISYSVSYTHLDVYKRQHLQGAVVDVDLIRELDAHAVDQPVDGLAAVLHRDLGERRVKMIRRVVHQVRIHRVVGELDALRLLQLGIPSGNHALGRCV